MGESPTDAEWKRPGTVNADPAPPFARLTSRAAAGIYPYPFIDVARIGWARTMANAAGIAAAFLGAGFLFVALDRLLARQD